MVSFAATADELKAVEYIIKRYEGAQRTKFSAARKSNLAMDLLACHANGCPMDFLRMSTAPLFDLAHDVLGIEKHIDRKTGHLDNRFLPRFAKAQ